jgi:hypothetical protein
MQICHMERIQIEAAPAAKNQSLRFGSSKDKIGAYGIFAVTPPPLFSTTTVQVLPYYIAECVDTNIRYEYSKHLID